MKVLIVEDVPQQALLIEGFLKMADSNAEAEILDTLSAAQDYLEETPVDAIFLDLGLPDGEGLEVILSIQEVAPDSPIIVLTAQGEDGLGELCLQAGAQDFMDKRELTPDGLARALRFSLSRKSESVLSEIGRTLERIRTLENGASEPLPDKFYFAYKKLLRRPTLQMSPAHKNFGSSLAALSATPETVLQLHSKCLEEVCQEADEKTLPGILEASHSSVVATLTYLAKHYQKRALVRDEA